MKYMVTQLRSIIGKARETKQYHGRATDDKRAFVEAIVLGVSDDPPDYNNKPATGSDAVLAAVAATNDSNKTTDAAAAAVVTPTTITITTDTIKSELPFSISSAAATSIVVVQQQQQQQQPQPRIRSKRMGPPPRPLSKSSRLRLLGIPTGTGLNMFDRLTPKLAEIMNGTYAYVLQYAYWWHIYDAYIYIIFSSSGCC